MNYILATLAVVINRLKKEAVSQLETVFLCFFYVFFLHKRLIFCIFISDLQMIIYEIQALQS
ncbi:hypothetical protein, partial [Flavobacterium sp.]|uniref:hypothetical protein n=1 Tax=Flavobacterium sp. TaxID=239 RepID=UPI0022BB8F02